MKLKKRIYTLLAIFIAINITSCKDSKNEDKEDPTTGEETTYNNKWIYEQMKEYYLWNTDITTSPNLKETDTEKFFNSLRYRINKVDGDRFSWIEEDISKNSSKSAGTNQLGFELLPKVYIEKVLAGSTPTQIGFFITQIHENSAATNKLQRGNIIYEIDGKKITSDNYEDMYYFLQEASHVKLSFYNKQGNQQTEEITAKNSYDKENPIWMCKIVEKDNIKVGYIVYNKFEKGEADSKDSYKYDIELVEKIGQLYTNGIKNIVLDLRYNPGGYVTSALNLASALVSDRKESNVFAISEYNANLTEKDYPTKDYFADYVYKGDEREEHKNRLASIPKGNLDHLYIIATENSASASELTIAALRPYMRDKLKHIGTTTVGKDKGSFTLEKADDDRIKWKLHPLVSRIGNSDGSVKGYTNGLDPDIHIDEWTEGYTITQGSYNDGSAAYVPTIYPWKGGWKELGDPDEPLLATAFADIAGKTIKKSASTEPYKTISTPIPVLKKVRSEAMWITKQAIED